MSLDVEALLDLWGRPHAPGPASEAAFAELYTDPVTVNGQRVERRDLVARAVALGATFSDLEREVLHVVHAPGSVCVAFALRGRLVGSLDTPAGPVAPTGARLEIRVIDLLTVVDGRVSEVWMVADHLSGLAATHLLVPRPAGDR